MKRDKFCYSKELDKAIISKADLIREKLIDVFRSQIITYGLGLQEDANYKEYLSGMYELAKEQLKVKYWETQQEIEEEKARDDRPAAFDDYTVEDWEKLDETLGESNRQHEEE